LVLYVKALSLLAKSMDIASLWWSRKTRSESSTAVNSAARDAANSQALAVRINSVVQWIRSRFNEVLEKAEIVRLKLIEAQKQLPEDHPSHPNNHPEAISTSSSSAEGVFLSSGVNAEKLMYDRALDMSRAAAINEIANEDLPGCEISYVTAIRMLEAVIDQDDDHLPKRRLSTASKDDKVAFGDEISGEMNSDDQQSVQKLIQMANSRLTTVRKKMQMIARASKAQQQSQQPQQQSMRRRSGEITSRSVPAS
jgi:serine/threonine-protein kinase ULK/ATG1